MIIKSSVQIQFITVHRATSLTVQQAAAMQLCLLRLVKTNIDPHMSRVGTSSAAHSKPQGVSSRYANFYKTYIQSMPTCKIQ